MTMAIMMLGFTACTDDNDDTPASKQEQESLHSYEKITILY